MKYILFLLMISLFQNSFSQYALSKNIFQTSLLLEFVVGNKTYFGTGFTLREKRNNKDYVFIVTAKHVIGETDSIGKITQLKGSTLLVSSFKDLKTESQATVSINLQKMLDSKSILYLDNYDIVLIPIIKIEDEKMIFDSNADFKQVSGKEQFFWTYIETQQFVKMIDVGLGNDCFISGYPKSIGLQNYPQYDYSKPLIRKGSIAGIYQDKKTIIIDCKADHGNSGGPVYEIRPLENQMKLIGVISQLIPQFTDLGKDNSGYSVIVPTDMILEVLNVYYK